MSTTGRSVSQKLVLAVLVFGLVAFILYFVLFINPSQVISILSKTTLAVYSSAFVAYSLSALFSSLAWRNLLSSLSIKISVGRALLFTWVGLFFEATVPQLGWSGEVSKTYFLNKETSVDSGSIGASVVGQKIFNMTTTVAAMALGLGLVLVSYPLPLIVSFLVSIVLSLSILTLTLVYYVSIRPLATEKLLNWGIRLITFFRKRWNSSSFRDKAQAFLGGFHVGIQHLRAEPAALVKPITYMVASFILEVSATFITFIALGYPVPVDKVLIVFTLTGTLQTLGVAFFGFPDLIMSVSFTALGIPAALSVSVTLLTRVVTLWFRLIVSYTALQYVGMKILRRS